MTCINIWTNQSSGSLPNRHLKNMAAVRNVLGIPGGIFQFITTIWT